jgi:hypothetical protein
MTEAKKLNFTLAELEMLERLHNLSRDNKTTMKNVDEGACFYCGQTCKYEDVKEWLGKKSSTAMCPHCGIDAVMPVYAPYVKSEKVIGMMMVRWFTTVEEDSNLLTTEPDALIPDRWKQWYKKYTVPA